LGGKTGNAARRSYPHRTGSRVRSVYEFDSEAGTATLLTRDRWSQSGASHESDTYEYVYCDVTGLHITHKIVNSTTTAAGNTLTENVTTEYDVGFLRPNTPTLGDAWTAVSEGTRQSDDGSPPQAFSTSGSYEVTEDEVTVYPPFLAMKFEQTDGPD
jgi:hypothetical protein